MTYRQLAQRVFNRVTFKPNMLDPKGGGIYNDTWLLKYQLYYCHGRCLLKGTYYIANTEINGKDFLLTKD